MSSKKFDEDDFIDTLDSLQFKRLRSGEVDRQTFGNWGLLAFIPIFYKKYAEWKKKAEREGVLDAASQSPIGYSAYPTKKPLDKVFEDGKNYTTTLSFRNIDGTPTAVVRERIEVQQGVIPRTIIRDVIPNKRGKINC